MEYFYPDVKTIISKRDDWKRSSNGHVMMTIITGWKVLFSFQMETSVKLLGNFGPWAMGFCCFTHKYPLQA